MKLVDFHSFSRQPAPLPAWRIVPLAGTFDVVCEDARSAWTTRTLDARALKLGPGRTLSGGTDRRPGSAGACAPTASVASPTSGAASASRPASPTGCRPAPRRDGG
ncbi:hypothetical protein [Methylobacterium sp. Leaf456]|uniref:hypothetical protein n=1 Tax=Methylobacterium sp. Leaf456 TaxID=1736382 RepID=UPI003369C266